MTLQLARHTVRFNVKNHHGTIHLQRNVSPKFAFACYPTVVAEHEPVRMLDSRQCD